MASALTGTPAAWAEETMSSSVCCASDRIAVRKMSWAWAPASASRMGTSKVATSRSPHS